MSDKTMKPVWRMNTGNGVPSDFGGFVLYENQTRPMDKRKHSYFCINGYYFELKNDGYDITSYQTNRTKEAKYELVKCKRCRGEGKHVVSLLCPALTVCQNCKEKGHTRRPIK